MNEDRFVSSSSLGWKTIESLWDELKKVEILLNHWHDKLEHRAFGEIQDGDISYEDWRDIYTSNGWVEVAEFQCCYDPNKDSKSVNISEGYASYIEDKAYLTIWKIWYKYHQLWRGRLQKLESTRFDIRRVTQSAKLTEDETLFVCLGLSPSVFGTPHFRPLSLYEKTFAIDDIEFQDFEGNKRAINSGLYDENGLAPMEWFLKNTEEYKLLERNDSLKAVCGKFVRTKFLKWAFKHKYLKEYVIKYRDLNNSPYGEKFALKLFNHLSEGGVIRGNFEEMWQWNVAFGWNSLHWMADELQEIVPHKITYQFKAIKQYIDTKGMRSNLKDQYEPTPENEFEKKRHSEKFQLIGRCLTQLELELDKEKADGKKSKEGA